MPISIGKQSFLIVPSNSIAQLNNGRLMWSFLLQKCTYDSLVTKTTNEVSFQLDFTGSWGSEEKCVSVATAGGFTSAEMEF